MPLESGDFPVLSFFITVYICSSVAISIGVPSFSEEQDCGKINGGSEKILAVKIFIILRF
jgi:hypothetical protein